MKSGRLKIDSLLVLIMLAPNLAFLLNNVLPLTVMFLKVDAISVNLVLSFIEEDVKEAVDLTKFIMLQEVFVSVMMDMRE